LKRLQGRMNVKSPDKEILPFSIYYSDELPWNTVLNTRF
jgi:hypothetical protein